MLSGFAVVTKTPVIVSTGLYGIMPHFAYSEIFSSFNVVNAPSLLNKRSFEDICDKYEKDKMPLIIHSSFDPRILDSHRLERALLIDPAILPSFGTSGFVPTKVSARAPINILRSKMYDSFVKKPFQPELESATCIQVEHGGHSDILDGMWSLLGSRLGIPADDSSGVAKYKDYISVYIGEWLSMTSNQLAVYTIEE